MSNFTENQKQHLSVFIGLMFLDLLITSIGYMCYSGFSEANPIYQQFIDIPWVFISAITATKVVVIAAVLCLVVWLNRSGEDILGSRISIVCSVTMAVLIGGLFTYNVVIV